MWIGAYGEGGNSKKKSKFMPLLDLGLIKSRLNSYSYII